MQGYVSMDWKKWMQSFQVKQKKSGVTVLTGKVADQSALQGLLDYLFDMGITLLSIKRIEFKLRWTHIHFNLLQFINCII